MTMIRIALFTVLVAACGGKQTTGTGAGAGSSDSGGSGSAAPVGVAKDTRTEIEKRRDAACDLLGPRMTKCAVEDAKAAYAAGTIKKAEADAILAPEVQAKNTEEFVKACKVPMSTHQVRVLEVCPVEETECGPMLSCLEHVNDKPAAK